MDTVIQDSDELILICEDDDKAILSDRPEERFAEQIVHAPHVPSRSFRKILFIGFNPNLLSVICEMCPYVLAKSQLDFLVPDDTDTVLLDTTLKKCEIGYTITNGITFSNDALKMLDYDRLDTIVVVANHPSDGERSDSETLLTILHLKSILEEKNLDIPIIIEIERIQNEPILQYASVNDFIVSNVLSNKMLCQIAENRHLNDVFFELLGEEGSEIYLKPAKQYVKLEEPVDFYAVIESAALKGEMAIGYRLKRIHEIGGVVINPNKQDLIVFSAGDTVVVLAED
jgi:hypothetical protein